jgi:uncharacterized protein (TIGR03435 family)
MTLWNIVLIGFDLQPGQLVAPDWTKEPRFNIMARIPKGATREQFFRMLQNMLIERFGLRFHRDQKEVEGYALDVGKSGPKFKESGPEPPKDAATPEEPRPRTGTRPSLGPDGFPEAAPGLSGLWISANRARGQWLSAPIEKLATALAYHLGKPVVDATGLNGKYDLRLYWVPDPDFAPHPGGPALFAALQDQLGLKLEAKKKIPIPVVVVDRAEKLPTDN